MIPHKLQTVARTLRSGQFWYLFPHHLYRWLRDRDAEQTPPVSTTAYGKSTEVPELHLLTGTGSVGDLLYAAKSFVTHYGAPIALVIHGDGTLTPTDTRRLARHFPDGRVFTKDERDEQVLPVLERRELGHCKAFRDANVFGERLVDVSVLSRGRMVINMDTDCLAFSSLDALRAVASDEVAGYIQDPQARPFSISDRAARDRFGVEPVRHFNAGLCAFPQERLDLNRVESWLTPSGYPMETHYAEQTILAALAALGASRPLPTPAYTFGVAGDETAFVHYADHYLSETRVAMRRDGQKHVLRELTEPERGSRTSASSSVSSTL